MKTHRILIPLDHSDLSRRILDPVQAFFPPETTALTLLHVADEPRIPRELTLGAAHERRPASALPLEGADAASPIRAEPAPREQNPTYPREQLVETERQRWTAELEQTARPLRAAGYEVTTDIRLGDPATMIESVIDASSIDLVAMTTRARSGPRRWLTGSVADQVVRSASVPVLLLNPATGPSA